MVTHSFKAAPDENSLSTAQEHFHQCGESPACIKHEEKEAVQSHKTDNQPEVFQYSEWKQTRLQREEFICTHVSQTHTHLS